MKRLLTTIAFTLGGLMCVSHTFADQSISGFLQKVLTPTTQSAPSVGSIEVAFSPNRGAEDLIIKVINSAQTEIKMMAYSFTSANITRALLAARKRGVEIKIVVDYKSNLSDDRSGKPRAALSALKESGVDVVAIDAYAIHHDKVIITDRATVQTGSFNYSAAAATRNSENVVVLWGNPQIANLYLEHFSRNYNLANPVRFN